MTLQIQFPLPLTCLSGTPPCPCAPPRWGSAAAVPPAAPPQLHCSECATRVPRASAADALAGRQRRLGSCRALWRVLPGLCAALRARLRRALGAAPWRERSHRLMGCGVAVLCRRRCRAVRLASGAAVPLALPALSLAINRNLSLPLPLCPPPYDSPLFARGDKQNKATRFLRLHSAGACARGTLHT